MFHFSVKLKVAMDNANHGTRIKDKLHAARKLVPWLGSRDTRKLLRPSCRMQSLVSLEGYDPDLRGYLLEHKWPAIMEVIS